MTGNTAKFSVGGGEDTVHSRVTPPQGLAGMVVLRNRPRTRLPTISRRPVTRIQEPTVAIICPLWNLGK